MRRSQLTALLPCSHAPLQPSLRSGKTGAHLLKHAVTPAVAAAAAAAFGPDQLGAGRAILELKWVIPAGCWA